MLWEGRPVRALNAHYSLHLIKSPLGCHSFTIDGLSESHITVIRDAIFLLPLASTPRTSLLRVSLEDIKSLFLVHSRLIVDYLIDFVV